MKKGFQFGVVFVIIVAVAGLWKFGAFVRVPVAYQQMFRSAYKDYKEVISTNCTEGARVSGVVAEGKLAPFKMNILDPLNLTSFALESDPLLLKLLPRERIAKSPEETGTLVVTKVTPRYGGEYTPDGKPTKGNVPTAECLLDDLDIHLINMKTGECSVYRLQAHGECANVIEKKTADSSNFHIRVRDDEIMALLQ